MRLKIRESFRCVGGITAWLPETSFSSNFFSDSKTHPNVNTPMHTPGSAFRLLGEGNGDKWTWKLVWQEHCDSPSQWFLREWVGVNTTAKCFTLPLITRSFCQVWLPGWLLWEKLWALSYPLTLRERRLNFLSYIWVSVVTRITHKKVCVSGRRVLALSTTLQSPKGRFFGTECSM